MSVRFSAVIASLLFVNITSLVAVKSVKTADPLTAYRDNAKQSAQQLIERSEILKQKVGTGEIVLIPALYNVDTGIVSFDEFLK